MGLRMCQSSNWFGVIVILFVMLTGCKPHDNTYYQIHPQALFSALTHCAGTTSSDLACQNLKKMAQSFQKLALSLERDPHAFGQQIIGLEVHCSSSMLSLKEKDTCQETLQRRLAVVKWLESPENRQ